MPKPARLFACALILASAAGCARGEDHFQLTSPAFADQGRLPGAQALNAMGCTGANHSPALAWKGAPAGTKSFALTLYDPDAPTGSGWWHWVVFNLPADARRLAEGPAPLPAGAVQGRTDFGTPGYGGACPPVGGKPHRYVFTLYALDVATLDVPPDASGAMVGYNLNAHALAKTTLTAFHGR
jgi:Raf kinase inhibitor-like YbhB/YbcL family protein